MYKLVYSPNIKKSDNINYCYKDGKIHVRLNKFGHKNQIISGFEDKLSFLVTFLINKFVDREILSKDVMNKALNDKDDSLLNNIVDSFIKESEEYELVRDTISKHLHVESSDFKIVTLNYKRIKSSLDRIGECYLFLNDDSIYYCDLSLFFYHLNFMSSNDKIDEFLFNDKYYIEISNKEFKVNNDKFIKKYAERENYTKLW